MRHSAVAARARQPSALGAAPAQPVPPRRKAILEAMDVTVYNSMAVSRAVYMVLLMALASLPACGSDEPLKVTTIQLGRSLNPDKSVGTHTTRFKPDDTIYTSVLTTGSGSATISVRWLFAGRVVSEPSQKVSYKGDAYTEFHMQNSGGFPAGDYNVEILLNGQPAGSREFRVER